MDDASVLMLANGGQLLNAYDRCSGTDIRLGSKVVNLLPCY